MEEIYLTKNLNDFFSNFINDFNGYFIFVNNPSTRYYTIDVRLYYLKNELVSLYSYSELMEYIMEILIQLLKDNHNLNLIDVNFYKEHWCKLYEYSLGKFAERQLKIK